MCVALYIYKVGSYLIVLIIMSWLVVVTRRKPKLVAQDQSSCHLEKLIFYIAKAEKHRWASELTPEYQQNRLCNPADKNISASCIYLRGWLLGRCGWSDRS